MVEAVIKEWKNWLLRASIGFVIVAALLYMAMELWWTLQDVNPSTLIAFLVVCAVVAPIVGFAWSYWRVVLVAVLGMVIGAVAGFVPYFVMVIIMMLLEQSAEGQVTSRQLSQLFNNDAFNQLFFVAGAASGGPIAVYAYHERKKREAEKDVGR